MLRTILFSGIMAFSLAGQAVPNKRADQKQAFEFITQGAFKGGKAGKGFSILNAKRVLSPSKRAERFIVEVGDDKGTAYNGKPGYFHVQLHKNPLRMSIDFSQILDNRVSSKKLSTLFRNSYLVSKTSLRSDATELSTNMTLFFKKSVKARVYTLSPKGNTPKVVIDFVQTK